MTANLDLMDYDVVGLAGWRRAQIKRQMATEKDLRITLTVHKGGPFKQDLFAAALEDALKWLGPVDIKYQIWPLSDWNHQLATAAINYFPEAYKFDAKKMNELVLAYNKEKPLKDSLFLEHYCYLAAWARRQKIDPSLELILNYEVSRGLMEIRDYGFQKLNLNILKANETLQVFDHSEFQVSVLPGKNISAMYVNPETGEVITSPLTPEEARILDLLDEGLALSQAQLMQLIFDFKRSESQSVQDWSALILQMIKKGFVLEGAA